MNSGNSLKAKAYAAPDSPGVYIMKDSAHEVIYIGKAKSLKKRLVSYFGKGLSSKTAALMSGVKDIEFRLTSTEEMALILEAGLIRQYKPKYNISLRDDKSFPMIKITDEEFPAVCITRKKEADQARYFGPYTSSKLLRQALKIIRRNFPFRSCRQLPKSACIYYKIGLSPAPCIGKINKKDYSRTIKNISLILQGKTDELVEKLSARMNEKSAQQQYEEAGRLRDQISALSSLGAAQGRTLSAGELEGLKNLLHLQKLPERIEAFDISNIYGKEACGSMVSFYRAFPDKDNYRRFRIKTVEKIDDYKMTREVVRRRYARVLEGKKPFPDLILIDGGKAHLFAALDEIGALGLKIPVAAIAKEKENIYLKGKKHPLRLKEGSAALNLIRRLRDEAHRFAVSYHHILRRKKIIGK